MANVNKWPKGVVPYILDSSVGKLIFDVSRALTVNIVRLVTIYLDQLCLWSRVGEYMYACTLFMMVFIYDIKYTSHAGRIIYHYLHTELCLPGNMCAVTN